MLAARLHGHKDIRVETIDKVQPSDDELLLKVAYNGVCGSDLHEYLGPVKSHKPHVLTGELLPRTWGHEFCGTVVGSGRAVDSATYPVGTRVAVNPTFGCEECGQCKQKTINTCTKLGFVGIAGRGGGLAEFVCVKPSQVHPLSSNISLKSGAMVEPAAVAWRAARRAQPLANSTVFVLGGGPIGCLLVRCLRAQGAERVILSEPTEVRRKFAEQSGAITLDPAACDVKEEVMRLTDGLGCDTVFDAAGVASLVPLLLSITKVRGTFVNLAYTPKPVPINLQMDLTYSEKCLTGSSCYADVDYREVIEALGSGKLVIEDLVTSVLPLEHTPQAFEALASSNAGTMKILIGSEE